MPVSVKHLAQLVRSSTPPDITHVVRPNGQRARQQDRPEAVFVTDRRPSLHGIASSSLMYSLIVIERVSVPERRRLTHHGI
jgi:hypothetical protein